MHPRWLIFGVLVCLHAAAGSFSPESLAPVVAGSIYLPLMPLEAIGAPVFGRAESGGWAAPSLLGWVVVLALWAAIWFTLATFLSRLFTKRSGPA